MSGLVYVCGQKGGTTKTTTAQMLCLGAVLCNQPAVYVVTDPHRILKDKGRPFYVLDGRDPEKLAQIITAIKKNDNGWLIVDGGGNRLAFDKTISAQADLSLLPFRASGEDTDMILADMEAMPEAMAWPCAWPTNWMAEQEAQRHIDKIKAAYPLRLIEQPLYFVNCASQLLDENLDYPAAPLRNAARKAFAIMAECFEERGRAQQQRAAVA